MRLLARPDRDVSPRVRLIRGCGFLGLAGGTTFAAVLVVLHLQRPELSVLGDFVSDYANGRLGGLFTFGVLVHGLGNAAITVALGWALPRRGTAVLGTLAFGLATVGLLLGGLFPTDADGAAPSFSGLVHRAAVTAAFPVELLALLLLLAAFRVSPAWRGYAPWSLGITVAAAAALGWLFVAVQTGQAVGLAERAALGAFLAWELSTGYRLTRYTRPATKRGSDGGLLVRTGP